jgi:hypothetical protein
MAKIKRAVSVIRKKLTGKKRYFASLLLSAFFMLHSAIPAYAAGISGSPIVTGTEKAKTAAKDAVTPLIDPVPAAETYVTTSPDENVFTIGARTNRKILEIMTINPGISSEPLPVGTVVKLPPAK